MQLRKFSQKPESLDEKKMLDYFPTSDPQTRLAYNMNDANSNMI